MAHLLAHEMQSIVMDIVFAKLPKHNFRKNLQKSGYWEKYEAVYEVRTSENRYST